MACFPLISTYPEDVLSRFVLVSGSYYQLDMGYYHNFEPMISDLTFPHASFLPLYPSMVANITPLNLSDSVFRPASKFLLALRPAIADIIEHRAIHREPNFYANNRDLPISPSNDVIHLSPTVGKSSSSRIHRSYWLLIYMKNQHRPHGLSWSQ